MPTFATLTGRRGWRAFQHQQLHAFGEPNPGRHASLGLPNASARIEIADLKERIRKLEAIAVGRGSVTHIPSPALAPSPAKPSRTGRCNRGPSHPTKRRQLRPGLRRGRRKSSKQQ